MFLAEFNLLRLPVRSTSYAAVFLPEYVFYLVDGSIRYEYRLIGESEIDSASSHPGVDDSFPEGITCEDPSNVLSPENVPSVDN